MTETTPFRTVIKLCLVVIGLMLMTTYVVFQARHLIIGPEIVLFDAPATHQNERLVHLSGQTHNISRLWLNGRQIYTDAKGRFEEALILENGYTIATLRAEDRYGRETTVTREFVYTPASFIE
ncbi:hypothetical protein KC851_00520 [Candidatus Kaiserbacteria bacterium]|nr:hypothetical protein [Candidatus Kaiserbacteria bacterium]